MSQDEEHSQGDDASAATMPDTTAEAFTLRTTAGSTQSLSRDAKQRKLNALLRHCPDAIVMVDVDGLVTEWNPAAESMLAAPHRAAIGEPVRDLLPPHMGEHFEAAWQQLLSGVAVTRFEAQGSGGDVAEQEISVIVAPVQSRGALAGALVILRNLTAETAKAFFRASLDEAPRGPDTGSAVTNVDNDGPAGLPGRRWLQRCLSEPAATGMSRGIAVLDVDVVSFPNLSPGPDASDRALDEFAKLLRSLDTPGTFAHLRADVFVWVVDSLDPVRALNECVIELKSALDEPFVVGVDELWLTLNVGLATDTLVAGGHLLEAARDALRFARQTGGSSALYYDGSMEASAASGFKLANDLHFAVENDELRLHYQPIMDIATNEISGVEALVRWERPGVGLLAPDSFIDVAERTGHIVALGNWVARTACSNALRLGSHSGGPRTMSINVSARQLRDPGLIDTLFEAMFDAGCAPSTIIVEVTESVLVNDLNTVAASLMAIKSLDVGVDLDDFGTGYSSLQYLRNLPVDRLKVDRSFVAGLGVNRTDTAIVASTIALAHALGLQAIAEGVETAEQLVLLREMGCDFAQGYLLSRPTDIETLTTWLDAYVPAAIPSTTAEVAATLLHGRADAADIRDVAAGSRDTIADRRDTIADRRDTNADRRDTGASIRDTIAAERDTAADDREGNNGPTREPGSRGDADSARRAAKHDRSLATADRLIDERDRARAGESRDHATAERASEANARAEEQADLLHG